MTNEVVEVKKETALATNFGFETEETSARDILVPKILFMQPVSKLVHAEKALSGELRGSLDGCLLAERGKGVEFIAFQKFKTRVTFKRVKGKQEYVGTAPWHPDFEAVPRIEIKNGEEFEHFETLNYYIILTEDIKKDEAFPYLLTFRSTAYKTGKALETYRAKLSMAGKPLPFKTFTLTLDKTENDKGTFYVPAVTMGRNSTDQELNTVKKWHALISTSQVKHDESFEESDTTTTINVSTPSSDTAERMVF